MVLQTLVSFYNCIRHVASIHPPFGSPYSIYNFQLIHSFTEVFQHAPAEEAGKRKLFIVVSSDKGLCGGIHSSVSKATRREFAEKDKVEEDSPVMVIGDKSKAQLSRALPKNLVMTFNQIGRDIPSFADAAGVADLILTSGVEYDTLAIVYNKFVSAISYEPAVIEVEPEKILKESRTSETLAPSNYVLTESTQPASARTRWRMT